MGNVAVSIPMRLHLLCAALVALSSSAIAVESMRIDGVPVYGRLHDVSADELREAVADTKYDLGENPSSIEVMGPDAMRAYLPDRELGWIPERRIKCCVKRRWGLDGMDISGSPNVHRFIRTANEAYVFPLPNPLKPHRDDLRLRRLDASSRAGLVRFLGYEQDWFHGFDNRIWTDDKLPPSVGFVFRQGQSELVLFIIDGGRVTGTFNGEHKSGTLEGSAWKGLESWKHRYALPEMGSK